MNDEGWDLYEHDVISCLWPVAGTPAIMSCSSMLAGLVHGGANRRSPKLVRFRSTLPFGENGGAQRNGGGSPVLHKRSAQGRENRCDVRGRSSDLLGRQVLIEPFLLAWRRLIFEAINKIVNRLHHAEQGRGCEESRLARVPVGQIVADDGHHRRV